MSSKIIDRFISLSEINTFRCSSAEKTEERHKDNTNKSTHIVDTQYNSGTIVRACSSAWLFVVVFNVDKLMIVDGDHEVNSWNSVNWCSVCMISVCISLQNHLGVVVYPWYIIYVQCIQFVWHKHTYFR